MTKLLSLFLLIHFSCLRALIIENQSSHQINIAFVKEIRAFENSISYGDLFAAKGVLFNVLESRNLAPGQIFRVELKEFVANHKKTYPSPESYALWIGSFECYRLWREKKLEAYARALRYSTLYSYHKIIIRDNDWSFKLLLERAV